MPKDQWAIDRITKLAKRNSMSAAQQKLTDEEYDRLVEAEMLKLKQPKEATLPESKRPAVEKEFRLGGTNKVKKIPKGKRSKELVTYMGRTPCKVYFDNTTDPPIRIELAEKDWIWPK